MSHFSVLVAIPGSDLEESATTIANCYLADIMEPYCESTENPAYLSFEDIEDKCREEYRTDTCRAIRFPDGHIVPAYSSAAREYFDVDSDGLHINEKHGPEYLDEELEEMLAQSELLNDYPCNKVYPTFDAYMEQYHGASNKNLHHRYGFYSNPQAEWDWYQIGGRWPGAFLVKKSNMDFIASEDSGEDFRVEGYTPCSGARKKDVCWDKMKSLAQDALREKYHKLCDILSGARKMDGMMRIEDGSLFGWGEYPILKAGESETEFLKRNRAGDDELGIPLFFAYIDTDGYWHSQGTMGWFGLSSSNKSEDAWNRECREFIEERDDNTVLVMVDCHI